MTAENGNHENACWEKIWELQNHQARMAGFYEGMKAQKEHAAYDAAMMYGANHMNKPVAGNGTKLMAILGTVSFSLVAAALLGGGN